MDGIRQRAAESAMQAGIHFHLPPSPSNPSPSLLRAAGTVNAVLCGTGEYTTGYVASSGGLMG